MPSLSQIKEYFLKVIKFLLFVLLIPVVIAVTAVFYKHIAALDLLFRLPFAAGLVMYLILHLFICELEGLQTFGQTLLTNLFRFLGPFTEVVPLLLPVYSILFLLGLLLERHFVKSLTIEATLIFLSGMSLAMHAVLTAKALRAKDTGTLKPDYFFTFSLSFIATIGVVALLLWGVVPGFSFPHFVKGTFRAAQQIYLVVYRQLF